MGSFIYEAEDDEEGVEVERLRRKLQTASFEALLSISDARKDLDDIEREINNAACGRPYTSGGQVFNVRADAMFSDLWNTRDRLDCARGGDVSDA
jgi:hypothetical protein